MMVFKHYLYIDGLESDRIHTQFLTEEDSLSWADFFKHPEAIRFLGLSALNLPDNDAISRHMINKQLDRYATKRFGLQKILLKETNTFIGLCGLLLQEIDGVPAIEIGYHFFAEFWGNGYATEAAALFETFAFEQLNCPNVRSVIDKENHRSRMVALRNHFEFEKETNWLNNERVFIYKKLNPNFMISEF